MFPISPAIEIWLRGKSKLNILIREVQIMQRHREPEIHHIICGSSRFSVGKNNLLTSRKTPRDVIL